MTGVLVASVIIAACTDSFVQDLRKLALQFQAAGTGFGKVTGPNIDCGHGATKCSASYTRHRTVNLAVVPDQGSQFAGWGGDCLSHGTDLNIALKMDLDLTCSLQFDLASGGGFTPHGTLSFNYRIEAAGLTGTTVFTAGYDSFEGEKIDFSDPDNPSSPAGAEFSACTPARTGSIFLDPNPAYNADVFFATCTSARQGSFTPVAGGLTQLAFFNFEPGASALIPGTTWLAIADFEFGQLRLQDQSATPQPEKVIPLSNPLERSCPFSLKVEGSYAYVAGREGQVGTSTANCNNWRGLWKVDLTNYVVTDFLPFGTMPRNVEYGSDNMVYVTDFAEDSVYVVDPLSMSLARTIAVGDGPVGLKLKLDASALLVTNWNANQLQLIDLSNDTEIDHVASGGVHPVDVFLSGSTAAVLNYGDAGMNTGASLKFFTIP
jgi:YVTN family beta-propeller protein